jgi:serine phosphatase RsbU (regulator of sigma subunit)
MAKRGGPSISVKMILTTTVLIVVTGVGAGLLNVVNIRRSFDESAARRVELFETARTQIGRLGTPLFARAAQALVLERGRDPEILTLVQNAVREDTRDDKGRRDYVLRLAYVLDQNQQVIASCIEAAQVECKLPEGHQAVGPALGPLVVASWQRVAGAVKSGALVEQDLTADGTRYKIFGYPIMAGEAIGYVVLGYDMTPVTWFKDEADAQKTEAVRTAALYTALVGALFALIGTVLAILLGLSISKPIKQLAWRANQIARGDLDARVDVTSGDEIGLLGESFNYMADQIAILLQQATDNAKLEQELEVAKTIQETLVPRPEPVRKGALAFAGHYQPATQTGGDWWTWAELDATRVLVVIGDVTGHGMPSAMITAAAKAACDVARYVHGDAVTVTKLLETMNHAIFENAQRRFTMTCFASIIDTQRRTITFANAGHNFPYLLRQGEFASLMMRGNRLGDDPASKFEAKTAELSAGDVLVWYTDGIVECENVAGEEYGDKRFRASVRNAAALDVGEMRDAIIADADAYFATMPRKDDITLIAGRIV